MPFQNTRKAAFYRWFSDGELIGSIAYFAGQNSAPDGWVLCDGSAVSRDTYATLFSAVGTIYGTGDGSTTFNLPNLVDKFVEGSTTSGTVKNAGLPNITGSSSTTVLTSSPASTSFMDGAITMSAPGTVGFQTGSNITNRALTFDASKSNAIYGKSTTVQPPALTMKPFIYTGKTTLYKWLRTA